MAARPPGGILDIVMIAEGMGGLDLKRSAVGMFAGFLVVAIMREIIIEETAGVSEKPPTAVLLLCGSFPDRYDGTRLHRLAPLLPLFNRFLAIFCRVSGHTLRLCRYFAPEKFEDIFVLILVDHHSELGRDCGVSLGLIFEPTAKGHEALDEVNNGGLFIEF